MQPAHAQPQAQQQQHQQFPHQGLNGGWQSDKDYQERRKMIAKIVHLLQQRKPNAPQEWLKKLPQMAKRLEESLYRSAKSFDEYNDANTLKQRLQQLAVNIGMKTKKLQQQQQALLQQQRAQAAQQQQQQQQQAAATNQQYVRQTSAQTTTAARQPLVKPQTTTTTQQPLAAIQAAPAAQPRMVNMAEINPIMGAAAQPATTTSTAAATAVTTTTAATQQPAPIQAPAAAAPVQQIQYTKPQQPQQPKAAAVAAPNGAAPAATTATATTATAAGAGATAGAGRQIANRQQVLRHQQQRLLLLRHAAKCQHEDGRCPVTPHCAGMKRLWKHIAECKNQKCLVPHCVSSRYVLSHYHRCKDVRCPVCGPVREAIHRSHEKQKHMQALKQRHQQAVQQKEQMQGGAAPAVAASSAAVAAPATVTTSSTTTTTTTTVGSAPAVQSAAIPTQPLAQPIQPGSTAEPPSKRRRSSAGVLPAPTFQVQQRPLQQPTASRPGLPVLPGAAAGRQQLVASVPQGTRAQVGTAPGIAFANGQVIMPKHTGPKPQEDHTLINCFSVEQIELHVESLNNGLQLPPNKLKTKCLEVLKMLQSHQHGWVFNAPVDPVELGLPDYFEVIKKPMDLGTIRKKLENGVYTKLDSFESHVHLCFDNAMLYNPEGSVVYNMAQEMKETFNRDYAKLIQQLNEEEDIKRKNGEACLLCGCEKLLFEPPVFYCNGMNCPSKRIRRNSYYYVGGNNQYHWCHQCYQELRDNATIDLGDVSVKKEGLTKKKNDEVHEESWVQCDRCERWVHQICALFNTRQNKDQRSEYCCPRCTIEERRKKGNLEARSSTPMAEDLPRTKLSEHLERHVRDKVNEFIEKKSVEKSKNDKIPIEEARKKLQMGGAITIRQVTSMDRKLEVRDRMKKRYAFKNYPEEFSFRCKCIIVFQNLDGVDVMLFGLYVYEHDEDNPAPNKRTVYVSYLDSVHYMRPRQMRTFIYHEILISYLDYVRRRGFSTAHIWACPPLKGDDYILYAKPEDQKTPKDDRLRQWYVDMLVESQRRGIVGTVTNMFDLYFSNPSNDATIVPYMDGDYFPAEAENIIKDIEEGKTGKRSGQSKKKEKKAKQKKKSGRGGTRSTGLDEDALKASGILPAGADQKSLEEGGRDYVMTKLGETIQPMKESFLVAFLAWEEAREEDMVVPKEIQEFRDKNNITWRIKPSEDDSAAETTEGKADAPSSCNGAKAEAPASGSEPQTGVGGNAATSGNNAVAPGSGDAMQVDKPAGEAAAAPANAQPQATASAPAPVAPAAPATNPPVPVQNADPSGVPSGVAAPIPSAPAPASSDPAATNGAGPTATTGVEAEKATSATAGAPAPATNASATAGTEEKKGSNGAAATADAAVMSIRSGKFAAMAARKRDRDGVPKESEKKEGKKEKKKADKVSKTITVKDSKGRMVKVLDDDDEELDCEFLNNRQAFLNLCQGNHYQFDQIRRAKHSSMMVLWHLHNRDAPKFVQQCATCSREILAGMRYHCPTCADFDQCADCVGNPKVPRHAHPLKPVAISTGQQNELTEAQRKERQRSIQLHMTLLQHAATCNSAKCPSANCTKMKGLLKHGAQCQIKATGGCNVCKRIWALLQIHARQCKLKSCLVPNCMAIRERVRQLKKQQQAMDDRRRLEMNRAYRGKR